MPNYSLTIYCMLINYISVVSTNAIRSMIHCTVWLPIIENYYITCIGYICTIEQR